MNLLLKKKFYHCVLLEEHVFAGRFLALKYDAMTEAGNVLFILVQHNVI